MIYLNINLYICIMIDEREDKDRLKCPKCGAFLMEVKPRLVIGQEIKCKCWKCHNDISIKK